ncbi:MAG TPA: sulfatase, partial [Pirellulales bacterium]|nr:sulfatase [Pirellulales bacterium]
AREMKRLGRELGFALLAWFVVVPRVDAGNAPSAKPNLLVLLADQWRADALGYVGDPNVQTPHLDRLARESMNFARAVSNCPVCCPTRASLMTGQRPLTHGVFLNDVPLPDKAVTIAEVLQAAGYATGYIGKWHLDGRGRSNFTPPERRQGFHYWKALECTHDYNQSFYFADDPTRLVWPGYDAIAQTRDAEEYVRGQAALGRPFALFLAWGAPHNPYHTAPDEYRARYEPDDIRLRPNVPEKLAIPARRELAGYYAHCSALDDLVGKLWETFKQAGIEENTILVFTSDHGDMLYSQGEVRKQKPWEESIRVPMLIHWPAGLRRAGRRLDAAFNSEDLLPTLLGLMGVVVPEMVEGHDLSGAMRGHDTPSDDASLITCVSPFGEWSRQHGGREFRGVRTRRHLYVRDLSGPWLLYDMDADPYQLHNLCNQDEHAALQAGLEAQLQRKLAETNDEFLPGPKYIEQFGYKVDATGTVPYTP